MSKRLLPAEWYPQDGVMFTWPHAKSDWKPWLKQIDQLYGQIVKNISQYEKLLLVCFDQAHQRHIEQILKANSVNLKQIIFRVAPSNDSWARDHGPISIIKDGKPCLLDFGFNGWGGKFAADQDDQISQKLYSQNSFTSIDLEAWPLILEGGSIDSDGEGTLLTTEHCLLTPTRNPDYDKSAVEKILKQSFGVNRVLWLTKGELAGDDTDSHIDMLARFCDPQTIAYTSCEDQSDLHYALLKAMEDELKQFKTKQGKPYTLVSLPIPAAIFNDEGDRLPASYANFLIINKAVLLPVYGDPMDKIASERLAKCFPGRKIIEINCRVLIEQFGSLHCISMQLPKGTL